MSQILTAEQVNLLGLKSQLLLTPKTAPAAMNRYICLVPPDGKGLKVLPSSPLNLFKSPFFFTLLSSILKERYWPDNRIPPIPVPEEEKAAKSLFMKVYDDESVDAFLTRRFGSTAARLFGSSLVHGVYAADSRRLSVRASFPSLWDAAERGKGSVVTGIVRKKACTKPEEAFDIGDVAAVMKDTSVFSFRDGIAALPVALAERLGSMPSVQVRLSSRVAALEPREEEVEVSAKVNISLVLGLYVSLFPSNDHTDPATRRDQHIRIPCGLSFASRQP
jgi:oxygen-dependent protoporphyrinogen oxidase